MHRELAHADEGPVPERFNITRDVIEQVAAADPTRLAVASVDHLGVIARRTYARVAADANRWTALLRDRGLGPGDRLLVHLGQASEWYDVLLGAFKSGIVAVPSRPGALAPELAFYGGHADVRLVVTQRRYARELARMDVPVDVVFADEMNVELLGVPVTHPTHDTTVGDLALIAYAPRAPGDPFGVAHLHGYTLTSGQLAEHWLGTRPGDIVWCSAQVGSARSLRSALAAFSTGAGLVVHDGDFDAEQTLDLIERLEVTTLCLTPPEYEALASTPEIGRFDLSRVRHAVSTGAKLDREVMVLFAGATGLVIHDVYGQSETGIVVANAHGARLKPGSIGTALPGRDVAVVDADGYEVGDGVEGELAVRTGTPGLFVGYWDEPEATAEAFRGPWYMTRDRAVRDRDGYFWLRERMAEQRAGTLDVGSQAEIPAAATGPRDAA